MNPMIIQDICGRALGFWTYQVTQEIRLQETVLKEAKERTAYMEKQVANIVREANSEISLMSDKIQDLKVELDQCMRKNRELAESNRESMKQYTKLKMQYEKVMSKSTFASTFAKPQLATETVPLPAQVMYTVGQKPAHTTGTVHGVNNRVGATPSRAFQPVPVQASTRRHNGNHNVENLRPVKIVNNSSLPPAHIGQNYGSRSNVSHSSTGSGRNAHVTNNGIVQKHGSLYAMEGSVHQAYGNGMADFSGKRSMNTANGHGPPNGKFRISNPVSANPAGHMGRNTIPPD